MLDVLILGQAESGNQSHEDHTNQKPQKIHFSSSKENNSYPSSFGRGLTLAPAPPKRRGSLNPRKRLGILTRFHPFNTVAKRRSHIRDAVVMNSSVPGQYPFKVIIQKLM